MESNNTKAPMLKPALNYGAILGIALVIYQTILYFAHLATNNFMGMLSYLIVIAGIYLAARKFRDDFCSGSITYGRALGFSTLTIIFASFILAVFTYIQYTIIDPGLIERILEIAEENMINQGMPEEQIDIAMTWAEKFTTPGVLTFNVFFGMVLIGVLISLITSIFVKKGSNSALNTGNY